MNCFIKCSMTAYKMDYDNQNSVSVYGNNNGISVNDNYKNTGFNTLKLLALVFCYLIVAGVFW